MRRDITPEQEAERLVRLRDEKGFDAFKWRIGAECGRDIDAWPGRTEAIVPQVARALGDDVARLVDANSAFSARRADRKSTRLNSSHSQISYAVFCLKKKNNHVAPSRQPL